MASRGACEGIQNVRPKHFGRLDAGDRLDAVIGGAEQDAAQPEEIARDLEVDDLPFSVGQDLVGTGPAIGQDEGRGILLTLVDHLVPGQKAATAPVEPCKRFKIDLRQGDEGRELSCQRAFLNQGWGFHEG